MSIASEARTDAQMCSVAARGFGEDPAGSAGKWKACLAVEVSPPWGQDIAESAGFPQGLSEVLKRAEKATGVSVRVQGLMPDTEYSVEGHTRLVLFSRPRGHAARFDREEYLVPRDRAAQVVDSLLNPSGDSAEIAEYRQDTGQVRDVLVCTHGNRDACCARFGYHIYEALREGYAPASGGRLRVWRTSHTGGHRFAPTLVDMPEGRSWAWLDEDSLEKVMLRQGDAAALRSHYRGWSLLDSDQEQVAEREAFMREGWDWTERYVSSQVLGRDRGKGTVKVRLEFMSPSGCPSGTYVVAVEQAEGVQAVDCMTPGSMKENRQYRAASVRRIS